MAGDGRRRKRKENVDEGAASTQLRAAAATEESVLVGFCEINETSKMLEDFLDWRLRNVDGAASTELAAADDVFVSSAVYDINEMSKRLRRIADEGWASTKLVAAPGTIEFLLRAKYEIGERLERLSNKLLLVGSSMAVTDGNMNKVSENFRISYSIRSQLEIFASWKGQQVAARVIEDPNKDGWFIVKAMNFDRETKEFEVLEEEPGDEEESGGQRKYKVPAAHIIPFPKQNDPSGAQDFPSGSHVLAVYPGTTALYKAIVVNSRKRRTEDYLLEFDDDEENGAMPQRKVPFFNVVPLPEGRVSVSGVSECS